MESLHAQDPRRLSSFALLGRLGSGGMGHVYLGRSAGGRLVAVKVIRPELASDPAFRARFAQEVAAARRVSGMFTAPVADAGPDDPVPWLATAYVPGPSLADAVSEHGPLPSASALALAAGLAEGLAAVHAAGIVHRDLKPSNVLLAADGPRLIDFGISRAADCIALTRTGFVVGSPGFMSPEQAEGREVGPASDVFSLGAVLAYAATGQEPFGEGTTPALLYRVVHTQPRLSGIPGPLRSLVERCLAKDPALRPAPAQVLSEASSQGTVLAGPAAGWLPAPIAAGLSRYPSAGRQPAAAADAVPTAPPAAAQPYQPTIGPDQPAAAPQAQVPFWPAGHPAGNTGRQGRRSPWKWAAIATVAAAVLAAASTVATFEIPHLMAERAATTSGQSAPGRPAAQGQARSSGSPASSTPAGGVSPPQNIPESTAQAPDPNAAGTVPGSGAANGGQASGNGLVTVTQAVLGQPDEPQVVTFLTDYFDAINHHDYQGYISLLGPQWRQSETPGAFYRGYRTTRDSHAVLTAITTSPGEVAATVTFISHQAPAHSATGTACTSWRITLFLEPEGGSLVMVPSPPGYQAAFWPC